MTELLATEKIVCPEEQEPAADSLAPTGSGYQVLSQVLSDVQKQTGPVEGFYAYRHHIDRWSDSWANSMDDD